MDSSRGFFNQRPKDLFRVESVRVTAGRPGFRLQQSQLASIVKERFFGDRTLFAYSPLPEGHIRLLKLKRGYLKDALDCELWSIPLSAEPYYEALSYEWGEGPPVHKLKLRDFTTDLKLKPQEEKDAKRLRAMVLRKVGANFFIRENLYQALRHLRKEDADIALWNDAICINQNDFVEKERQIAMMSEIYNGAFQVSIWLGMKSGKSDMAMDFVRDVVRFENHHALFQKEDSVQKWDALLELMCSRWFSRRWVIQELALARKANVLCGMKIVAWSDLADAVSIFKDKLQDVEAGFRDMPRHFKLDKEKLSTVEAMGASALVEAHTHLLRKDEYGDVKEKRLGLDYLVTTLVSFDCMDPRDTIYALLALARDNPQKELKPSQNKSLLEVFTEFIKYCIEKSKSLDMICRYWAPSRTTLPPPPNRPLEKLKNRKTTLPSWIRQLDDSAFGTPDRIFRGRRNADGLVGDPRNPNYNASSKRILKLEEVHFGKRAVVMTAPPSSKLPAHIETFDGTLIIKGFVLGSVGSISPRIISGIIPQEALQMGGWTYSLKQDDLPTDKVPDRLWRTLVAGRASGAQHPPGWYKRACLYSLLREDNSGDIHTRDLIDKPDSPEQMVTYLKRVQNVVWNRKVFKGDNDLFGLASRNVEVGDLICILFGCSVPVILREHPDGPITRPEISEPPTPTLEHFRELSTNMPQRPPMSRHNSSSTSTRGSLKRKPSQLRPSTPDQQKLGNAEAMIDISAQTQNSDQSSTNNNKREQGVTENATSNATELDVNSSEAKSNVAFEFGPRALCYKLICECYVDGMMDGEAFDRKTGEQFFKLV